jgi:3-(3-hydroxy-phenyl)propionate hydroxylase
MSHELVSFQDHGDFVATTFQTSTGSTTVAGSYLCGADGSKSVVRSQLNLGFAGMTYEDRFLLIGTDLDLRPYYPAIGPVNYMYDPEEWVIILHLPDVVRIVFRLRDEENADEALRETAVRQRISRFLEAEASYNIKSISVYNVHQRVADTFWVGRVLLLGDAAHINNPSGGMGMNSGIHDAHFLAPRLTAVLQGESAQLLDEYSQVRHQAALKMVQTYSDKNYKDLAADDDKYRQQRNETMRKMAADPEQARAYLLQASMLDGRI